MAEYTHVCHCSHFPCVPRTEDWAMQGKTQRLETPPLCTEVMNSLGHWRPGGSLRVNIHGLHGVSTLNMFPRSLA